MKIWVKMLLVGFGSGAAGFGLGYFFGKKKKSVKQDSDAQEHTENEAEETPRRKIRISHVMRKSYEEVLERNGYAAKENRREEDEDFDIEKAAKQIEKSMAEVQNPLEYTPPYLVDAIHYEGNPDEYDKENLYFYEVDGILADAVGGMVEDEPDAIGDDAIDFINNDPDWQECYVQNDNYRILYHIERVPNSYAEVYGR